jgi:hypothetical protein
MFFKNKLNVLGIVIILVLILGGCKLFNREKDRVGYGIVISSNGAKNIVLYLPAPVRNGKPMNNLINNLKFENNKSATLKNTNLKLKNSKYGPMIEAKIGELVGEVRLNGVDLEKNIISISNRRPYKIDFWLNPRIINNKRYFQTNKTETKVNVEKQEKKETVIGVFYEGNPIGIRLDMGARTQDFPGWMTYSWIVKQGSEKINYEQTFININEPGYKRVEFEEYAVSDLGGI